MSFLNAALLPGLIALTALPLVIHLLNLQFPRLFEFPSVRHLRVTIAQRSRMHRWRHLILLLLRTLFVAALLLAFLKPLLPRFGSAAEASTARSVLLLIDHSMSMEHKGGGLSSRDRAVVEAGKILSTLGPEDRVNVMLVGQTLPTCFVDFSRNHTEARRFLGAIKPGLSLADFTQANAAAARLLGKTPRGAEVYYLSDFQRKNWANVDFTPVPPAARAFFVDVGAPNRANRAILAATVNQAQILTGDTVTLEIEVGNFRDEPMREPVKLVLDGRVSFEKEVSVAPWTVGKITMPVPPGAPGLHTCELSLAPDELTADDHYSLTLPVIEKEGILIVSDAPDPEKDAVLYLKTALNPYEDLAGSLMPEVVKAAELKADRLAAVKKVFLTRCGRLSPDSAKLLAAFVFNGGGVVYFLDGEVDAENLATIEQAAAAGPLPLKLGPKRVAENIGSGAQQIIKGEFKSRFLRLFRGAQRQNLALLEFYDIHDASATGAGQVLLTYADETPAMAAFSHGLGTLLLMNFSVSEASSNLARQRVFPAWMQDVVKSLTSDEPRPLSTVIGQTVEDEVWRQEIAGAALRRPSGEVLEPKTEPLGERVALAFTPDELGLYTMRGQRLVRAYGVNANPDECDLRPIDRALLPEQLGAKGQQGFFVGGSDDFEDIVRGRPVFHWFIFAALALLLAESAFQLLLRRSATSPPR